MAVNQEHGGLCALRCYSGIFRLLCQSGTELAHWSHYEVPDYFGGIPYEQLGGGHRRGYCSHAWRHGLREHRKLLQESQERQITPKLTLTPISGKPACRLHAGISFL